MERERRDKASASEQLGHYGFYIFLVKVVEAASERALGHWQLLFEVGLLSLPLH